MQRSQGWIQEFHYFRAIAIIEVIVLHSAGWVYLSGVTTLNPQKDILIALVALTSFAVPHFVLISGVVLYNKYNVSFSLSAFYKRRFSAVLPPYLIWGTFYFFYPYAGVAIYASVFHHSMAQSAAYAIPGIIPLLSEWLLGLVSGTHLAFVALIMQFYLLYPVLMAFYNRFAKQRNPLYVLSLLLLVQTVYVSLFVYRVPPTPYYNNVFLSMIFYFVLGFYISEHYGTIKQAIARVQLWSISLAVVLSTIYYAVAYYQTVLLPSPSPVYYWLFQITGPFYCLILVAFYLRISIWWGEPHEFFTRSLEKIGEASFGVYLTQFAFGFVFAYLLFEVGLSYDNLLFYPILAALTLISSYLSVQALYRLPFSAIIIGERRKPKVSPPAAAQEALPTRQS